MKTAKAAEVTVENVKAETTSMLKAAFPVVAGGGLIYSVAVILTRFLPWLYNKLSFGGRVNPQAVMTGMIAGFMTLVAIPFRGKVAEYLKAGAVGAFGVGGARLLGDAILPYLESATNKVSGSTVETVVTQDANLSSPALKRIGMNPQQKSRMYLSKSRLGSRVGLGNLIEREIYGGHV